MNIISLNKRIDITDFVNCATCGHTIFMAQRYLLSYDADVYYFQSILEWIPKVSQNVEPLHNSFRILIHVCNYKCDMGYFVR